MLGGKYMPPQDTRVEEEEEVNDQDMVEEKVGEQEGVVEQEVVEPPNLSLLLHFLVLA